MGPEKRQRRALLSVLSVIQGAEAEARSTGNESWTVGDHSVNYTCAAGGGPEPHTGNINGAGNRNRTEKLESY